MAKQFNTALPYVPRDFRTLVEESARDYGERDAYIIKTRREKGDVPAEYRHVTYNEFKADVRILGTALRALFPEHAHLAVMGESRYEWCLTYLAVTTAGDVVVPTDKDLNREELIHVLSESGAQCIVLPDKLYEKALKEALPSLPALKLCVLMDAGSEIDPLDANGSPETNTWEGVKTVRFSRLMELGRALLDAGDTRYDETVIDPDAMSVLIFTSGTTGVSKGVMLSQKNIITDVVSVLSVLDHANGEETLLSILPIHHTYECTTTFLVSFRMGACVAFCDGLRYIGKNISEYRPTMLMLVPLILENLYGKIVKQAKATRAKWFGFRFLLGLSGVLRKFGINAGKRFFKSAHEALGGRIKLVVAGAAAMKPEVCRDLERMGFKVRQGYGLTETSPILCVNRDSGNEYESVGPALPGIELRIADPDSEERGEIQAKGPNVMLGYYNNEAATRAVFTDDGWFRTGDQGRLDSRGRLFITGRIKNIIVTNTGKNIYPEELEDKLSAIPYIKECMVWGCDAGDDEDTKVCVTVYPDLDAIKEAAAGAGETVPEDAAEAAEYVRKNIWSEIKQLNIDLPAYKRICALELRDSEFPKTSTNKIQRFKVTHGTLNGNRIE